MPSFFSRFKNRDGGKKAKNGNADNLADQQTAKRWEDASLRTSVEPEEIQELIRRCTGELKSRGTFDTAYTITVRLAARRAMHHS